SDTKGWNTFYTLDQGISYSRNFQLPVHNLVNDLSWTKGSHFPVRRQSRLRSRSSPELSTFLELSPGRDFLDGASRLCQHRGTKSLGPRQLHGRPQPLEWRT